MESILSNIIQNVAANAIGNILNNTTAAQENNQAQNDNDRFETLFSTDGNNLFEQDYEAEEVYGMAGQIVGQMAGGPAGALIGRIMGPIFGGIIDDIQTKIFGNLPGFEEIKETQNNISGALLSTLTGSRGINGSLGDIFNNGGSIESLLGEDEIISALFGNNANGLVA